MNDIIDEVDGFKPKKTGVIFYNIKGKAKKTQKCGSCGLEVHSWNDVIENNRVINSLCDKCFKEYEKIRWGNKK